MNELPKIRKTFLFSDIEGSTRLAQALGEGYAFVLERYRSIFQSAIRTFNGKVVDNAGDGFFAVFDAPEDAVAFAMTILRAYSAESWARGIRLRVRVGVHSGEAIASPEGFIGQEIHRASRICGAAHGGQALLSQAAVNELRDKLPKGAGVRLLGAFLLKDFDQAEPLYQLDISGLPADFPAPRTTAPIRSIAVLPFRNLSSDPQQEYFCDGIAEEIIISLGKIPDLQVVSRASSFALKGHDLSVAEIGQKLHANVLLEGAVRKIGAQLRITAELIDTAQGINLWSGRFDRQIKDLFAVQDEIAQNITAALRVKLGGLQTRNIRTVQTNNVQAYDYYIRGRRFYGQFSRQGVLLALQMFQKAIEEDAAYALAYSGLADCYAYLFSFYAANSENLLLAQQNSLRAVELDPLQAQGHISRGVALSLEAKYEEAEAAFERAIALDPQLFEVWYWYARVALTQGKLEKAAHLFEAAHRVQPDDFQSLLICGQVYEQLGQPEKAADARQRGVALAEHHLELNPGDARAYYLAANGLMALGQSAKSLNFLQNALDLAPDDAILLYNAGCIFALAGLKEKAIHALERAVQGGLKQKAWFENDSNLQSLREDPRFKDLLSKQ